MRSADLAFADYAKATTRGMPDYDLSLLWVVLALLALGLTMVYSASIAIAEGSRYTGYNPAYYLLRHSMYLAAGAVTAWIVLQIPLRAWNFLAPYLFICAAVLLILVLIPGIGREVNGSRRWLSLPFFTVQPSEFMKLFAVLYAASYAVRKAHSLHHKQPLKDSIVKGFLPLFGVMLLIGWLLLREPDFGAFFVILMIALAILFLGGLDFRLVASLLLLVPIGLLLLIWIAPYRLQRLTGFLDPWADPFDKGYQLSHALIAFGRGEWFGVGLGASVEKLFYLPEAHTDFLLAVIGEELGFLGVALVISLFACLLWRAFAIAKLAANLERPFNALVAQGIAVWFGVQSLINIGVNMGILPTKGLTLPLVSFGGSSLVANLLAMAVLLRVDYENRQILKGYQI